MRQSEVGQLPASWYWIHPADQAAVVFRGLPSAAPDQYPHRVIGWPFSILGVALCLFTANSVIRYLVIARGLKSVVSKNVERVVGRTLNFVAARCKTYEQRDSVLTWMAALNLVVLLFTWLFLFLIGFSLIIYSNSGFPFLISVREAGSSLFTLGFASTVRPQLEVVDFVAAATGPIVIALLIAYLPTMYSSYNRREVEVALLQARAGIPNWGPEILARHTIFGTEQQLHGLWHQWERWAVDVAESHSTYQSLIVTRSARPHRHYLVSLLAVMDAAALQIALRPRDHQGGARVMLRQGIEAFHDLGYVMSLSDRTLSLLPNTDPETSTPITLTRAEFEEAVRMLEDSGYKTQASDDEAWTMFVAWRCHYESVAYGLLKKLTAVPALWSGPREPALEPIRPIRPKYITRGGGPPRSD